MTRNIQVIDGAVNSTFPIYKVPEQCYAEVFLVGNVAFVDEVSAEFRRRGVDPEAFFSSMWQRAVLLEKRSVVGIDGTLHLSASNVKSRYFPNRRDADAYPYGDAGVF